LETDSLTVELTPLNNYKTSLPTPKQLRDDRESYQGATGSKKISTSPNYRLLGFFVCSVLPAAFAEFLELETAGGRLLVLRRRVVPLFAIRTLKSDDFTHIFILTDLAVLHALEIVP
jgi:hypothetical protein